MLHGSQFLFLVWWKIIPWSHMQHITGGISNPRFNFCVSKEVKVLSVIILQIQFLVGWCGHQVLHSSLRDQSSMKKWFAYCGHVLFKIPISSNSNCQQSVLNNFSFYWNQYLRLCLHFFKAIGMDQSYRALPEHLSICYPSVHVLANASYGIPFYLTI